MVRQLVTQRFGEMPPEFAARERSHSGTDAGERRAGPDVDGGPAPVGPEDPDPVRGRESGFN